jgi:arylsulfatase A-like enzyme
MLCARFLLGVLPLPRRALTCLLGSLLVTAVACGDPGQLDPEEADHDQPDQPNLLLISLDTLRADHLSCYGYERPTSPMIDALASRGVRFEWARSHSPKTGPSHMSLMTGLLPDAHGVPNLDQQDNRRLASGVPTLASLLSDAGWRTAAIHGGGHISRELGFDVGFERFDGPRGVEGGVGKALSLMEEWADEPFFLFLHTYEIHDPYVPPSPYRERFLDPDYEGGVTYTREELKSVAGKGWDQQHRLFWQQVDLQSLADRDRLIDLYDAGIAFADAQVGRLLQGLAALGLAEDTLVVLVSDHGEEFLEHGGYLHNAMYEELLHVPLVIRVPPRRAPSVPRAALSGGKVAAPVQLVDVLPTLLELLDVSAPGHLQGRSLLPLMRGEALPEPPGFAAWPRARAWALTSEGDKLIRREPPEGGVTHELFDLAGDPGEKQDHAADDPARVEELATRLMTLRDACRGYLSASESGGEVVLDEETRRSLEALGYLGGDN